MSQRTCVDCPATFEYVRGRPPKRCPECRRLIGLERTKAARRRLYARDPARFKAARRAQEKLRPRCEYQGCVNPRVHLDGFCRSHHSRVARTGSPDGLIQRAKRNNITPQGYRKIRHGGKQRFEHRVVMERLVGRPLEKWENVHHINGIRHDNRPKNLELWVTSQPSGQRPEDLAAWVVEHYPQIVRQALADYTEKESTHA